MWQGCNISNDILFLQYINLERDGHLLLDGAGVVHVAADVEQLCAGVSRPTEACQLHLELLAVYIRVAPDTELAGYPANLFCRISGIRLKS